MHAVIVKNDKKKALKLLEKSSGACFALASCRKVHASRGRDDLICHQNSTSVLFVWRRIDLESCRTTLFSSTPDMTAEKRQGLYITFKPRDTKWFSKNRKDRWDLRLQLPVSTLAILQFTYVVRFFVLQEVVKANMEFLQSRGQAPSSRGAPQSTSVTSLSLFPRQKQSEPCSLAEWVQRYRARFLESQIDMWLPMAGRVLDLNALISSGPGAEPSNRYLKNAQTGRSQKVD